MKRRFFLNALIPTTSPLALNANTQNQNETQPVQHTTTAPPAPEVQQSTAAIDIKAYNGTLTPEKASYLLRRTMFGVTNADLQKLKNLTPTQAVDLLLTPTDPNYLNIPPLNNYSFEEPTEKNNYTASLKTDEKGLAIGQSWLNTISEPTLLLSIMRGKSLLSWWYNNLINQPTNITEKMTFFWFNHFAIEANEVGQPNLIYDYIQLFRKNALGNFKTITKEVTKMPAMLKYLNGYLNSKAAPDENYGRELQELFTLGKGKDSKYTEADVKQAARVLTGYRYTLDHKKDILQPYTDPEQHDTGDKTFSDFFGNKTIKGRAGVQGMEQELDDLLNMIFDNNEVALFLCRRFYLFFVHANITPQIEETVIKPLAQIFKTSNYEIKPVIETLLKSNAFFNNNQTFIKNPLDYMVGMLRTFEVPFPELPAQNPRPEQIITAYRAYFLVHQILEADMLFNIANPPSVSGWPAYYQAPMYDQAWISVFTYSTRIHNATKFCNLTGGTQKQKDNLRIKLLYPPKSDIKPNDFPTYDSATNTYNMRNYWVFQPQFLQVVKKWENPEKAESIVNKAITILYAVPIQNSFKNTLLQTLNQNTDWNADWNNYTQNSQDPQKQIIVQTKLKNFFELILTQAEYQVG